MNIYKTLKRQLDKVISDMEKNDVNRDMPLSDVYWAISNLLRVGDRGYLSDMYIGSDGQLYAIYIDDGKMFRAPVIMGAGDQPLLGESVQVIQLFEPVEQAHRIIRDADGVYHGLAILSTAVINKDGEIDSRDLYDSFVERISEDGVRLNFHHFDIEFGTVKHIWRSEYVLWGYIKFDDSPIGRAAAKTLAADESNDWGISIEFTPTEQEFIEVNNVEVPVYKSGDLTRASVLKSDRAASWFTALPAIERGKQDMNKDVKQDFIDLVGAELADVAEELDDTINNRAVSEDMIRRDADANPDTDANSDGDIIEIDDSLVEVISENLSESDFFSGITQAVGGLEAQVAEIVSSISTLTQSVKMVEERSAQAEKELADLRERNTDAEQVYNLSRPSAPRTLVYKPGLKETPETTDLAARAAARMATLTTGKRV